MNVNHIGQWNGVNYCVNNNHAQYFPQTLRPIVLRFAKSRPLFCESCAATYRRICELFRALQSICRPVTDVENIVQINV